MGRPGNVQPTLTHGLGRSGVLSHYSIGIMSLVSVQMIAKQIVFDMSVIFCLNHLPGDSRLTRAMRDRMF